jgi:hypothetical protein
LGKPLSSFTWSMFLSILYNWPEEWGGGILHSLQQYPIGQYAYDNFFFGSWRFFSSDFLGGAPCLLGWAFLTTTLHVSWIKALFWTLKLNVAH